MPGPLPDIEASIPALRRYAHSLLRGRQEADDLVQDTLVRALDNLHRRREGGAIRPWLFTIMHNLFVSQLRRAKARPAGESLDAGATIDLPLPAHQEDALHWRDLLRGLDQLPAEQRSVILLVSVEDLSYAEVAGVLGIPLGTVMSRLARGRERLRQLTAETARPALRRVK